MLTCTSGYLTWCKVSIKHYSNLKIPLKSQRITTKCTAFIKYRNAYIIYGQAHNSMPPTFPHTHKPSTIQTDYLILFDLCGAGGVFLWDNQPPRSSTHGYIWTTRVFREECWNSLQSKPGIKIQTNKTPHNFWIGAVCGELLFWKCILILNYKTLVP